MKLRCSSALLAIKTALVSVSLLLLLLLLLLLVQESSGNEENERPHPLEFESFRLRSVVTINDITSYIVEEKYSPNQVRGIVQIGNRTKGEHLAPHDKRTFFVDNLYNVSVVRQGTQCTNGDESGALEFLRLKCADCEFSTRPHIIGTAKWLFYALRNKKQFTKSSRHPTNNQFLQNLPYEMYHMSLTGGQLYLFYTVLAPDQKQSEEDDHNRLPIKLLWSGETSVKVSIVFSTPELLSQVESGGGGGKLGACAPILDPFSLEPLSACVDTIWEQQRTKLLRANPGRFSFLAKVEHSSIALSRTLSYTMFVAYDQALQAMRVDLNGTSLGSEMVSSRQVFDFNIDRRYLLLLGADGVAGAPGATERNWCHVSRIGSAAQHFKQPHEIERVLLGANNFVYLGRAKVRGQEALVYEALDTELPFWLDQPHDFTDAAKAKDAVWDPSRRRYEQIKLVQLLYLSYQPSGPHIYVLMLEMIHTDCKYEKVYERRKIEMFDLKWRLDSAGLLVPGTSTSTSTSELFSLRSHCSDPLVGETGQIELLLEVPKASGLMHSLDTFLQLPVVERNYALLATIQKNLNVVTSMVFNFESKLVTHRGADADDKLQLVVSFGWARHTGLLTELVYIDECSQSNSKSASWRATRAASLAHCYALASHINQKEVYFIFNPTSDLCRIWSDESAKWHASGEQGTFATTAATANASELLQVFQVKHVSDTVNYHWWTNPAESVLSIYNRRQTALPIEGYANIDRAFKFSVARLSVRDGAALEQQSGGAQSSRSRLLDGFELAQMTGVSAKFEAPDAMQSSTSIADCQSACLAQVDCRLYSNCAGGLSSACVLSQASLVAGDEGAYANEAAHKALRSGQSIELDGENSQGESVKIRLVKRANCAVYTKHYSDYFKFRRVSVSERINVRVVPANMLEQCATFCAQMNFDKFRALARKVLDIDTKLDLAEPLWTSSKGEKFEKLRASFCTSFHFLDSLELRQHPDGIGQRLKQLARETSGSAQNESEKPKTYHEGGYCVLPMSLLPRPSEAAAAAAENVLSLRDVDVKLTEGEFKFQNLYEKIHGISLKESALNALEEQVYANLYYENPMDDLHEARALLSSGKNFQVNLQLDESACALACFTQSQGPWPRCRSFDLVVRPVANSESIEMRCLLNSATLAEILATNKRLELIDNDSFSSSANYFERWHYEPRGSLTVANNKKDEHVLEDEHSTTLSTIIYIGQLLALAVLAIASGLWFGTVFARFRLRSHFKQQIINGTANRKFVDNFPTYRNGNRDIGLTIMNMK